MFGGRTGSQVEWNGKAIRVIDPVSLLACKLDLAATVSENILLPCVQVFLNEFLTQVERGEIQASPWLGAADQVLKLTANNRARKITCKHEITGRKLSR